MSGLSEQEREALDEALWGGRIYDDVPAVVERIIDEREAPIRALAEEWERNSSLFDCTRRDDPYADARDDERVDVVLALRALLDGGDQS